MAQIDDRGKPHRITLALNDREMALLERLARQMDTSSQEAAQEALTQRLTRLARQGPGLTLPELKAAVATSELTDIVDANDTWDDSMIDEELVFERNHNGERLLDRIHFLVPPGPMLYHQATFQQDREAPHHWRAWLEPCDIDLGELGDLPEDCFPHASVREAADALADAYRERYPSPASSPR